MLVGPELCAASSGPCAAAPEKPAGPARFLTAVGLSAEVKALLAADLASMSLGSIAVAPGLMLCTLTAADPRLAVEWRALMFLLSCVHQLRMYDSA